MDVFSRLTLQEVAYSPRHVIFEAMARWGAEEQCMVEALLAAFSDEEDWMLDHVVASDADERHYPHLVWAWGNHLRVTIAHVDDEDQGYTSEYRLGRHVLSDPRLVADCIKTFVQTVRDYIVS